MKRRDFLKTSAAATAVAVSGVRVAFASSVNSSSEWWNSKAVRWLQTNMREPDAAVDPKKFVDEIASLNANAALVNAGGITAYYPTNIKFAHVSPYMPKGQDTFGEILDEAHSRNIRVVSRWDFSKARKEVYDAHPDWFFKMADGKPAIYNGLYQVCINGGWIQKKSLEILGEALDRYEVDGCFFNNFLNPESDYAGRNLGICHCDNCQIRYQEQYGRSVPEEADADYRRFMQECGRIISEKIIGLLRSKRPSAALVGGTPAITDVVYGESSTGIHRPLPLWPYTASDNVNKWKNSYPGTGVVCQSMQFLDFPWRFSAVPRREISTRIWQSVANGGFAAMSISGTLGKQRDRSAIAAAAPIYKWLKDHEEFYYNQLNEARVVLLATAQDGQSGAGFEGSTEAYRGMFRFLTEQHIPFASMTNLDWLGKRPVDLVITTGPVPKALEEFVSGGGNLLVASTMTPQFEIVPIVKRWQNPDGAYFQVHDKKLFHSLKDIDVAMMNGDYLELGTQEPAPLTFVPPAMYAPPEFVGLGWEDSGKPGLVMKRMGRGTVAWLPWDIGGLYYRHSLESHAGILTDLVDRLLPAGRDVRSNAHPLVEITLMRQQSRHLVHLVNLSGHSDTAYFNPLPMQSIEIQVKGRFTKARAIKAASNLIVKQNGPYAVLELPHLEEYELIELT